MGVFDGVKVLCFTYAGTANIAMRVLGMYGATVVRVESKSRPCNLRVSGPFRDNQPGLNRSGYYAMYNNDRYSIAVDMKHPKARRVIDGLLLWADIVAENFSPGTVERLGVDYAAVKAVNPEVVYLSISSQGQIGPYREMPSYGPQLQAFTGHVYMTGWPDRVPDQIGQSYPDFITPVYACAAVIAALDYKRRTGKGQYIDQANVEPTVHWLAPAILDYTANKVVEDRAGNSVPYAVPHNAYPCKDEDSWCAIAVMTDAEWLNLCKVMGKPELATDPMFATLLDRKKNEARLDSIIGEWTANLTSGEVMEKLQAAKVSAGKVMNMQEIVEDEQLRHRGFYKTLDHPEMGPYEALNTAYVLSRTPSEIRLPSPCIGEHSEYVCRELLGMSDEEFVELLNEGVFE